VFVVTSEPVVQSAMLKLSIGQIESDVVKPRVGITISAIEAWDPVCQERVDLY